MTWRKTSFNKAIGNSFNANSLPETKR